MLYYLYLFYEFGLFRRLLPCGFLGFLGTFGVCVSPWRGVEKVAGLDFSSVVLVSFLDLGAGTLGSFWIVRVVGGGVLEFDVGELALDFEVYDMCGETLERVLSVSSGAEVCSSVSFCVAGSSCGRRFRFSSVGEQGKGEGGGGSCGEEVF